MMAPLLRVPPALAQPALLGGLSTRLGFPDADQADRATARAVLARALGVDGERMAWLHQVHGREVLLASGPGLAGEGDALIDPGGRRLLLVTVADCCPILLWQQDGPAIAVAHAGWRGLVAGVVEATVEALAKHGIAAGSLRAWIGPSIGPESFEVGPEVAACFEARFVQERSPRPHVDLREAARARLLDAGLVETSIGVCADDTFARSELYWSYRRDHGIRGRHLGYLCRRQP